jgi:hypothetical protein
MQSRTLRRKSEEEAQLVPFLRARRLQRLLHKDSAVPKSGPRQERRARAWSNLQTVRPKIPSPPNAPRIPVLISKKKQ